MDVLETAGGHGVADAISALAEVGERYGLEVSGHGEIVSRSVRASALAPMIVLVANASREAAERLLSRFDPRSDHHLA